MVSLRLLNVATGILACLTLLTCSIGNATTVSGEHIYRQQCFACHGDTGLGDGPHAKKTNHVPYSFKDKTKNKELKVNTEKALTVGVKNEPGHAVWRLLTPEERASLLEYVDGLSKD